MVLREVGWEIRDLVYLEASAARREGFYLWRSWRQVPQSRFELLSGVPTYCPNNYAIFAGLNRN
jgi:hypothetical protein